MDIYKGNWINGKPDGKFRIYYHNNEIFFGNYVKREKNENDKLFLDDGDVYEGMLNGKRNGMGKLIKKDGTSYFGFWKENIMEGRFEITNPKGEKFLQYYHLGKCFNYQ